LSLDLLVVTLFSRVKGMTEKEAEDSDIIFCNFIESQDGLMERFIIIICNLLLFFKASKAKTFFFYNINLSWTSNKNLSPILKGDMGNWIAMECIN
jgi:hypothetical protein